MTHVNFRAALRAFCRRKPFLPFWIELVTGARFLVAHPEAIAFRGELVTQVGTDGTNKLFDSQSVCQLFDEPG